MSRIEYNEGYNQDDWLRAMGFDANTRKSIAGKKGQAFLKELETALIALPEKRLLWSVFAVSEGSNRAKYGGAGVCALGTVALKRKMDAGMTRERALVSIEEEYGKDFEPNETRNLAWSLMELNDETCGSMTPEQRYEHVLAWVRKKIVKETK